MGSDCYWFEDFLRADENVLTLTLGKGCSTLSITITGLCTFTGRMVCYVNHISIKHGLRTTRTSEANSKSEGWMSFYPRQTWRPLKGQRPGNSESRPEIPPAATGCPQASCFLSLTFSGFPPHLDQTQTPDSDALEGDPLPSLTSHPHSLATMSGHTGLLFVP